MVRRLLFILALIFLAEKSAHAFSIDLHSHLFMQEGVGPLLWGEIDEPSAASSWDSRFRTKMTTRSLDPSGLKLIVLSFYAHPVLTGGKAKEKLLAEIERAEAFVAAHPNWVIASEPGEARAALASGKRVFVLSIETAGGFLETKEDQDLFIDRKKVRLVTFMHLSPDALGRGVALWPGTGILNSPLEYLEALWLKHRDSETGALLNPHGLSAHGRTTLDELVRRRVWIDLAHASDRAQKEMSPVLEAAGQPALITHTRLREFGANERATPDFSLARVKATKGILGLVPTEDMTKPLSSKRSNELGLAESCRAGIRAYAEEWRRAVEKIGFSEGVALGSDFNSPLRGLRGGCASVAIDDAGLSQSGFYRGDDLPRLSRALAPFGVGADREEKTLSHFLDAWSRVRENRR